MGKRSEAERILKGLPPDVVDSAGMAVAYVALGDNDEAFKALFKMVDKRENANIYFKSDPSLDPLHSDPRWRQLLQRMNFHVEQ